MEIKIFESADKAAHFCAEEVAALSAQNPNCVLGLATGRTMDAPYHHLAQLHKESPFDCSGVRAFAVDDYIGLAPEDERSSKNYLDFHLYRSLGFKADHTHAPDTGASDLDEASFAYEQEIRQAGGIDLQLLGIGLNGHIAFNEPGSAHDSRTRLVGLAHKTRQSRAALFNDRPVPLTAITMGIGTIMEARRIILMATGATKAQIVQRLAHGDVNSQVPATALKLHKNATLVLDREAASLLSKAF